MSEKKVSYTLTQKQNVPVIHKLVVQEILGEKGTIKDVAVDIMVKS
jgi:hypothetical protein